MNPNPEDYPNQWAYLNSVERALDDANIRCSRVENENIALATANSELRSEVLRIKNRVREINSLPWSSDTVDALADFVEDWE